MYIAFKEPVSEEIASRIFENFSQELLIEKAVIKP
jgi:hypothetical protein